MPPGRTQRARGVGRGIAKAAARRFKSIACQRCHAKKVRCLGGHPCEACVQSDCVAECIYPERDRQIKISQIYLDRLLKENDSLRARSEESNRSSSEPAPTTCPGAATDRGEDEPTQNPLMEERPWFLPFKSSQIPILIGEVADPAFATRIRQTISKSPQNHIPRTAYPANDSIPDCPLPRLNHAHARFLLRTALSYLDGRYHIVRKSALWALFEQYIQVPASLDFLSKCKLSALFAFGELYSSQNRSSTEGLPGLAFFNNASKAYGVLHERPAADYVEICMILALYSLHINRRHSAYFLASSAIRHCIVMGLHFNLPDFQVHNAGTREHLHRLWWSAYLLDHQCATVSSQAVSVSDDEIHVDLPNEMQPSETHATDFQNTDSLVARLSLAKLTNKIVRTIYGRGAYINPFLYRVQSALKELQHWYRTIPANLNATAELSPYQGPATLNLHLSFNQCLILATRPVCLYVARVRMTAEGHSSGMDHLHTDTRALADACIRCARDSFNLINEAWIEGSVRTFDYFNTQHLFSATTILAIASLLDGCEEDRHKFEFASHLLEKLRDAGSYPAREYCQHLEGIKANMRSLSAGAQPLQEATLTGLLAGEVTQHSTAIQPPTYRVDAGPALPTTQQAAGSSGVFTEPSICAFLSQDEFYPAQLDDFLNDTQMQGIYWPTLDSDLDTPC